MKSNWKILMMVTFLMNFKPNFSQYMNRFEKLLINGSTDLTVSEQFRGAYSFYTVQGLSLLKCASFCSINNNCLIFSIKKSENNSECEFFSSQNLDESEIISKSYSSVYRKKLNNLETTITTTTSTTTITTTTTTITTTTNADFTCLGDHCSCFDSMSYFSKSLNKCVKCRDGWTAYKSICYKGFSSVKKWQDFVNYCSSLNSTLLIADTSEKFDFFRPISKDLTTASGKSRTWVYAKYDVIGVYQWINLKTINTSFFGNGLITSFTGCFCYDTFYSSLLSITTCTTFSNGICEYSD